MAVLEADELVDWRVSCFREPSFAKATDGKPVCDALLDAVERRVRGLIQRFEPTVMAIEEPSEVRLRMSPALAGVVARIRSVAQDAGLRFVAVSPLRVRKQVCGAEKATHAQMSERIVERYPHLGRYCRCSSQWQEDYWRPMFSAVGVCLFILWESGADCGIAWEESSQGG